MNESTELARDGQEIKFHDAGQDWTASWHPPVLPAPSGTPWGSAGVCMVDNGDVVLVSSDGELWGLPGGRPEGNEDWRATLDREVFEEACVRVDDAKLLGFNKGVCTRGPEEGRVLIRSLWQARVTMEPWEQHHEMISRLLVRPDQALVRMVLPRGVRPIYRRMFQEAFAI
jgi:ADP-ribose pyrophosphatase YjhB (NUDIX family)